MASSLEISDERLKLSIKRKDQKFDSLLEVAYYVVQKADSRTEIYRMARDYVDAYKHFKDYLGDEGLY